MKLIHAFLASLLLTSSTVADEIRISAAISLKDALTTIASDYKTTAGDEILFTFGSSGQLATQIKDGADVDAFISAATKQIDDLLAANVADPGTRRVIAGNALVLIVPSVAKDAPDSIAALANTRFKRVAIGEPKSVPAGDYAMQTLSALKLADSLTDRLVYGTNVRQVLAYVEGGDVAAGLVYTTDALESGSKIRIVATADEKTHEPILYPAIIVKTSKKKVPALKFLDFLKSAQAQKTLSAKGFTLPPATTAPAAPVK